MESGAEHPGVMIEHDHEVASPDLMTVEALAEVIRLHGLWLAGCGSGVRADLVGANLVGATLVDAWLLKADMRDADLRGANLHMANLRGADLSGANLCGANIHMALMGSAVLDRAKFDEDLRVDVSDLDRLISEAVGDGSTLEMDDWHTACGTRHCRAGWAVVLAGEAGEDLEKKVGTSAAGALIYHFSTGRVPDFHASNDDAMADIRRCAEG